MNASLTYLTPEDAGSGDQTKAAHQLGSVNVMTMKDTLDETTLLCSLWFKPGSKELEGLAYRLNGLGALERYTEAV